MEDFDEEALHQSMREDQKAVDRAVNMLIDGVSSFTSAQGIENIPVGKWAEMLAALDYSKFVISGIMYSYGLDLNVSHYIEDGMDEEDDEGVE